MLSNSNSQRIHAITLFALFILPMSSAGWADSDLPEASESQPPARIELIDQSVIYGEITDIHDGELYVMTEWMGEVTIALSSVLQLVSNQDIELLTTEQEKLALSSFMISDGEVVLEDADNLTVDQLDVANPEEWEQGHGYRITGRVTSAIEYNRGNTETDKLNLDAESIFESRRDRITLRADYEESSAFVVEKDDNGDPALDDVGNVIKKSEPTADNWRVEGKYDYFLSEPRNYLGSTLGFRSNEFADIDRRSYISAYFGRKILTRETLTFDAEVGFSYVDTDFTESENDTESEDESYTGLNVNFSAEALLFDSNVTLYFRQANIINLSSAQKSIYRTKAGLRFPLLLGLEAAAEATADYDGGAAEGKQKLDQTLKFRIGYTW
ncbi:MAG: DUF481 domain-containing protein [Luminiphilus sp.]|nr:DUF481 domain-containing protein [Luminiphilus sp.]MBL6821597.1 DUF481 domain-containing protein [Luminiphilus sp.]